MIKEFVNYEQALELRELGLYEECFGYYYYDGSYKNWILNVDNEEFEYSKAISAPTFSQAIKFFRENHGLYSAITPKKSYPDNHITGIEWHIEIYGGDGIDIGPDGTYTYEEAESVLIDKLIEIVKQQNI